MPTTATAHGQRNPAGGWRRRRLAGITLAAVAMIGACSHSTHAAKPTTTTTTTTITTTTNPELQARGAGEPAPPAVLTSTLRTASAGKNVHVTVRSAQYVASTRGPANAVVSGAGIDSNQAVWVLQIQGSSAFDIGGPDGMVHETASAYQLIVDTTTGEVWDSGFGQAADLNNLGPVHQLDPSSVQAVIDAATAGH